MTLAVEAETLRIDQLCHLPSAFKNSSLDSVQWWKSIVLLFAVLYAPHDDDDHDCLMGPVAMAPLVILKIQLW